MPLPVTFGKTTTKCLINPDIPFQFNKMTSNKSKHNKPAGSSASSRLEKEATAEFPLGKRNFRLMIISAILIVGGFLLMLGGGSDADFNPDIFSVRRIVVGPTIAFIGFVSMAISIVLKPNSNN